MKVQEYISSGIIESYVLGLASLKERSEFESMYRQYPEIKMARIAFEKELENHAIKNGVTPPSTIKQKILGQINSGNQLSDTQKGSVRSINWMKYAAAASIVLLLGSLYWNYSLNTQNKKLSDELNSSASRLNEMENEMKVIQQNPGLKMAAMKGTEISPHSFATAYWDTTSKDVYLVINNLPKPPTDKQYQLWALLDGKPVDLGMVQNEFFIGQKKLLLRMKNVQGAQAFAITLEKLGGSSTPQGAMYVIGNL